MTTALPAGDLEVLEFERTRWKHQGAKESAILHRFAYSPARYYQRLNQIIDTPAAAAYDPQLVNRLRRLREDRQRRRGARQPGFEVTR